MEGQVLDVPTVEAGLSHALGLPGFVHPDGRMRWRARRGKSWTLRMGSGRRCECEGTLIKRVESKSSSGRVYHAAITSSQGRKALAAVALGCGKDEDRAWVMVYLSVQVGCPRFLAWSGRISRVGAEKLGQLVLCAPR